jgi:hypothetical protein
MKKKNLPHILVKEKKKLKVEFDPYSHFSHPICRCKFYLLTADN